MATAISNQATLTYELYIGLAHLYTDGVYTSDIEPTVSTQKDKITFTIASVSPMSAILIVYKVKTNEYASLVANTDKITNKATAVADTISLPVEAVVEIEAEGYALVEIEKTMSPNPVVDGSILTYTFVIKNYGNMEARNVVIRDAFEDGNVTENFSVTIDGTAFTDYNYTAGVLLIPGLTASYNFTIPAADMITDDSTGETVVTPAERIVQVKSHK